MNFLVSKQGKLLFASLVISLSLCAQPGEILLKMNQFNTTGKVLYIAAHPDDENTRLISYLVNARHYQTAYLSLTRGDGGQNLIGNEQSEELGLVRTQELIAARKADGGEQYFTRAYDFGYSKNPEETFSMWEHPAKAETTLSKGNKDLKKANPSAADLRPILADVVLVIRKFRPDVIVTRFPTTGEGGHGHHTASAMLAVEAFKLAADPTAFPEQLTLVKPWQATRLCWNNFMRWRDPKADMSGALSLEINEFIPELGKSIGEIAATSRSCHRSQGFGSKPQYDQITEYFNVIAGSEVKQDIMEGVVTDWSRITGGKAIQDQMNTILKQFSMTSPEASIPALVKLSKQVKDLPDFSEKALKQKQLNEIILACCGMQVQYVSKAEAAYPGKELKTELSLSLRAAVEDFKLESIYVAEAGNAILEKPELLNKGSFFQKEIDLNIPANAEYTNPYWLEKPIESGRFQVNDLKKIGQADVSPALVAQLKFSIQGTPCSVELPLEYRWVDPSRGELVRPLVIMPRSTAKVLPDLAVLSGQDERIIRIELSGSDLVGSRISLDLPPSIFQCEPADILIEEEKPVHTLSFKIRVSPNRMIKPDQAWDVKIIQRRDDVSSTLKSVTQIDYEHIPRQTWIRDAQLKLVHVNLKRGATRIAYLEGAGDKVADCLANAGYQVDQLKEVQTLESLKAYDAVVMGVRAFNTREDLAAWMPVLLEYIKQGGNLLVQYNTKNWISDVSLLPGPYSLNISRDRVTDENAEISFLLPDHPVLTYPNKLGKDDFSGWIQERGLYFPDSWDDHYQAILAAGDPGEKTSQGLILSCDYGKGRYVYTGLSFFRELPAGVPGAYRLFANLLAKRVADGR